MKEFLCLPGNLNHWMTQERNEYRNTRRFVCCQKALGSTQANHGDLIFEKFPREYPLLVIPDQGAV
jgi:hypothetical protein